MRLLLEIFAIAFVIAVFHPSDVCPPPPPDCDYGTVALCWCYEDSCDWYCTSDGR